MRTELLASTFFVLLLAGCGSSYEYRVSTTGDRDRRRASVAFDSTAHRFNGTIPIKIADSVAPTTREYVFPFQAEASVSLPHSNSVEVYLRQMSYWTDYSDRRQFRQFASAMDSALVEQFGRERVSVEHQFHNDQDPTLLFGIFPFAP